MKNLLQSLALLTLGIGLLNSCQKSMGTEKVENAKSAVENSMANCDQCVDTWAETAETLVADAGNNYYLDVSHDANNLYLTIYRTGGSKFTKIKNVLIKVGGTTIFNLAGPFGGGATSTLTYAVPFPSALTAADACKLVEISFESVGVGGGGGKVFSGVMYYVRKICSEPPPCDLTGYMTKSQGYYMSSPPGGRYLDANPSLGPVMIGCAGGTSANFSLAQIKAMQPGNSTYPGILAKQIITLTLNTRAAWNPGALGCLVVQTMDPALSMWNGYSVASILAIANDTWGGCDDTYTPAQMTAIVNAINLNFHGSNMNLLTCGICP
jgi:hypothetical protein